jgi:hypothetical protein
VRKIAPDAVPGSRACLQSPSPEDDRHDVQHSAEAPIGLFVARGNSPKSLDRTEEIFDQVTPLVLVRIVRGMPGRSLAERDNGFDPFASQPLAKPVCVECLVPDQSKACDASYEGVEAGDVVLLPRQKNEANDVAKRVNERRNFRGQTTARPADRLFLSPPFAPVPC